ncbi:MAG: hypothetical protein OEW83_00085 [Acidimicrobiia bacterium]|nr:hypothetical protein [Acidimicrobiia bacterium]
MAQLSTEPPSSSSASADCAVTPSRSRYAVFEECALCGGDLTPEHAHYRCGSCGWRDSCCD